MEDFSILIGGKAGYGIENSSILIAHFFNRLGYYIYVHRDYPSIIRGGHTFSIIRVSNRKTTSIKKKINFLLGLNQETIDNHKDLLDKDSFIIFDSDLVKAEGIKIPIDSIVKKDKASDFMRDPCMLGAFFKIIGLKWDFIEKILKEKVTKEFEMNLKMFQCGYNEAQEKIQINKNNNTYPLITGNDAISLGLINAGLNSYVAYPMTPASSILNFMDENKDKFNLKVLQAESEIGVILMALGFSYAKSKVAVGTSGGGFCLMTEGLSFSGIAEIPVVIVMSQRPGPATGLPTYSAQGELKYVINSGHGEFVKFVVAPGDMEEAFFWSSVSLNMAWKYQIPSIILSDKTLSESVSSFDMKVIDTIKEENFLENKEEKDYSRYKVTDNGISPLDFIPKKDNVIKVNSYEHDEKGITTEDAKIAKMMQEKRINKEKPLIEELEKYSMVNVYGNKNAEKAVVCWGSNKSVCIEAAEKFNIRVIHIIVVRPFPIKQFNEAIKGVKKIISMESNITGQMASILSSYGYKVDSKILKYDGRPYFIEDLEKEFEKELK